MKTLELILDLILRVLRGIENKLNQDRQEKLEGEYSRIRSSPRDLFDDGVLNNSDSSSGPSPSVPEATASRERE